MQPTHFLAFPNLLTLEQIAFLLILIGEKALDCTHIQRFAKPARTCNQRDFICIVPPLPDKIRLVNIEDVIVHHFLIILISKCMFDPHLTSPFYSIFFILPFLSEQSFGFCDEREALIRLFFLYGLCPIPPSSVRVSPVMYLKSGDAS